MFTKYHLNSAQDINSDFLDAIKAAFKSKPITIIVEEDEVDSELTSEMKAILDERINESEEKYLTDKDSIEELKKKYGL